MELSRPPLVVAFELSEKRKAIVADALAGASAVVYLTELDEAARAEALRNTGALLTFNTSKELRSGEAALLDGARLIQQGEARPVGRSLSAMRGGRPRFTRRLMYERRISRSISSTQPVKIGRLETAKCNMRRSESYEARGKAER